MSRSFIRPHGAAMSKAKQGKFKTSAGEILLRWYCYSADGYCRMIWAKNKGDAQKECEQRGMKVAKVEPAPAVSTLQ
jgi:hypothetical protein